MSIKRDTRSNYLTDYANLKVYWTSIAFIFFGLSVLIALLIVEMAFNF